MRKVGWTALALFVIDCGGSGPDPAAGPDQPQTPAPEVKVDKVFPELLGRGEELAITITGEGFDAGTTAEIGREGGPEGEIKVLGTEFRSASEVVATLRVAPTAAVSRYDVQVRSGRGRRGLGNERIGVMAVDVGIPGSAVDVTPTGITVGSLSAHVGQGLESRAFVWFPGQAPHALPVPAGTVDSRAEAINAAGDIVGWTDGTPSRWSGVTVGGGGSWSPLLPSPIGDGVNQPGSGTASAINDAGVVAGMIIAPNGMGGQVFCWSAERGARVSEVPWGGELGRVSGISDAGDAAGWAAVPFGENGNTQASWPQDGLPFVVHCHDAFPTFEQLPLLPGAVRGWVVAVGPDGTLYGGNGNLSGSASVDQPGTPVRWVRTGDQWEVEAFRQVKFRITRVTRGGRLIGDSGDGTYGRAWLWDPVLGLRELASLEVSSFASGAADRGPGTPLFVAGAIERYDGTRMALWPIIIEP